MNLEDNKNLSPDKKLEAESQQKSPEEEVDFEELKIKLEQEIKQEVQDFKDEDKKVSQIAESVNLENIEMVNKIKGDLQLDEKLQKINEEADRLKDELEEHANIKSNDTILGVDFVYNQNPDLLTIGTKEQYSNYLSTIFPESKLQDIVYHGTNVGIDDFKFKSLGLTSGHLIDNPEFAKAWADERVERLGGESKVYAFKVNITGGNGWSDGFINKYNNSGPITGNEITLYKEEDAFLLGSTKDKEHFKDFVSK